MMKRVVMGLAILTVAVFSQSVYAQTVAVWLFDEQTGIYPSAVLNDASDNDYPLVIGPGGMVVPGKFGNALEPVQQPAIVVPEGEREFGLERMPVPEGRTVEPLTWFNANFCALMTGGEEHLRKEVGFVQPTRTKLNLGNFDWTVEFWFMPVRKTDEEGVVFEIGTGPRGENEKVTRLSLNADLSGFTLRNEPGGISLIIPASEKALNPDSREWHHFAFVYSAGEEQLRHYIDGRMQPLPASCALRALETGEEDYLSVGRDGLWGRPLQGRLDELRFSRGMVYTKKFKPPGSFSPSLTGIEGKASLKKGMPLLFGPMAEKREVIALGGRKHLFIDDAMIAEMKDVQFTVNPPRLEERVIDGIIGSYRKHLTVIEDEEGLIRMYNSVSDDYLQIMVSKDGVHWDMPMTGTKYRNHWNIVIPEPVGGLGNPFIDPNGPPEHRWKYITGYHNRGIYLYTSPDGWSWTRQKTCFLPFRSGTQACTYYDDQRQLYVGYHRTGFAKTPGGDTQRGSILVESKDLYKPVPFKPVTQEETWEASRKRRYRDPQPWYLDNGPLTPGGFSLEFPWKFDPIENYDPVGMDFYITKALKYEWAPDTYFAFPIAYFHYEGDGPLTRRILMDPARKRGSGPIETQIAVSRDGVNWTRYPRPAYVGIGMFTGWDIHQSYLVHGMVQRGGEIWQYVFGLNEYHSTFADNDRERGVFRLVQRMDGFVSADTPYDREGVIVTKPFVFEGNCLVLNIDTDATGYAQVGFLDRNGDPVPGYTVDDCVYINGDFLETEIEWIGNQDAVTIPYGESVEAIQSELKKLDMYTDVSGLAGKTVRLVFRMRGAKLYGMQFVKR
jgi:hypothetical protein